MFYGLLGSLLGGGGKNVPSNHFLANKVFPIDLFARYPFCVLISSEMNFAAADSGPYFNGFGITAMPSIAEAP